MINVESTSDKVFDVCKRTSFDKLSQEELTEKIEEFKTTKSIRCFVGFDCTDLDFSGADLDNIIFCQCILDYSIFNGATLRSASFINCFASRAVFRGANMYRAMISESNFDHCDFSGCIMSDISLKRSSFVWSVFDGSLLLPNAVSTDTDFFGAKIDSISAIDFRKLSCARNVPNLPMTCSDSGAFIGWKQCRGGRIVKLLIPEDAKRLSAAGRKCRCDKAMVLEIQDILGKKLSDDVVTYSRYDPDFVYRVGETVSVDDFCEDRWEECAPGIHFFINRQEAVEY